LNPLWFHKQVWWRRRRVKRSLHGRNISFCEGNREDQLFWILLHSLGVSPCLDQILHRSAWELHWWNLQEFVLDHTTQGLPNLGIRQDFKWYPILVIKAELYPEARVSSRGFFVREARTAEILCRNFLINRGFRWPWLSWRWDETWWANLCFAHHRSSGCSPVAKPLLLTRYL
jgi:hypothetical protein